MLRKVLKNIFIFLLSFVILTLLLYYFAETVFRIQRKGWLAGIKSYFIVETPGSVLGTGDKIISDPILDYRLNPDIPGVNSYSMKEHEIKVPKPEGLTRVVILGDSVPYTGKPNFVDLLKEKYQVKNNIEILNASTPGYTTYQELQYLKKYLLKIDPDIVILAYVLNDNYKFLHTFDEESGMLWTEAAEQTLKTHTFLDDVINRSYFLSYLRLWLIKNYDDLTVIESEYPWDHTVDFNLAWKDIGWTEFDTNLRQMQNLIKGKKGNLLVVSFPLEDQLNLNFLQKNRNYVLKPQQKITEIVKKYEIPHLDLFPSFFKEETINNKKLYTDGLHLSEEGHKLSAEKIYSFLTKQL